MKFLLDHCHLDKDWDNNVRLGIGWYRHSKSFKWFGFTLDFYVFYWKVMFTFVSNWKEYDKRVNYRKYTKKDKK